MSRFVFLSLLLPLVGLAGPSADEILRRADAILAPPSFESEVTMSTVRANGEVRSFSLRVWKSGSQSHRIRFLSPADDRGTEVLRVGDEMWNYLPNLKRAVRISPKQEFHGGDFSNADVLRVNLADDYTPTLVEATRDEYHLSLAAKNESVAYETIHYWVRKKDCMPLRQEFYTSSGKKVRRLDFLEPKAFGRFVRPSRLMMFNLLVPSRRSEMVVSAFVVKSDLDGGLFQLASLGR